MKVHRSLGAVAIYSPPRAAALAAAGVLTVASLGFVVGLAFGDGSSSGSDSPGTATVTTLPGAASQPASPARHAPAKPARQRSGHARSTPAVGVAGNAPDLHVGGAYMVRLKRGGGAARFAIGPHVPVLPGHTYFLCSGGRTLCKTLGSGSR